MRYMALDIETGAIHGMALQQELDKVRPHPATKDEGKRKKQVEEKSESIRVKSALTDSAPVMCVGWKSNTSFVVVTAYKFGYVKEFERLGIKSIQCDNEKEMLRAISTELESSMTDECNLVKFNGKHFDLPKLRLAYARNGIAVKMPGIFMPHQDHIDLMLEYAYNYSVSNNKFPKITDVAAALGITEGGKGFSGKHFPEMIETGDYIGATIKNCIDVILTERIYLAMSPWV